MFSCDSEPRYSYYASHDLRGEARRCDPRQKQTRLDSLHFLPGSTAHDDLPFLRSTPNNTPLLPSDLPTPQDYNPQTTREHEPRRRTGSPYPLHGAQRSRLHNHNVDHVSFTPSEDARSVRNPLSSPSLEAAPTNTSHQRARASLTESAWKAVPVERNYQNVFGGRISGEVAGSACRVQSGYYIALA